MSHQQDIEHIEMSIDEAKKLVEKKNWLVKLDSNREFRKLVIKGYFEEEAARLAGLLGDPAAAKVRDDIIKDIESIGRLQNYFRTVFQIGLHAEQEIGEFEAELDDARQEDVEMEPS